jgi:hypothetical protein
MNSIMTKSLFPIVVFLAMFHTSCRDHEIVQPINEEELITTVKLTFKKWDDFGQPTGDPISFTWRDEDASGNPDIDEILLDAHSTYTLNLTILDESKTPVADVTEEIILEAAEHQFFFSITGPEMVIEYHDSDRNGKPVGLENFATIEHESSGSLTVILRHEPDKSAAGVMEGDLTNAGGDTDIEAVFPLTIIE